MNQSHLRPLILAAMAALPTFVHAGVGEIISPSVTKDQFEAQYHFTRSEDDRASKDDSMTHRAEFEYGFTDDWLGEIGFKFEDKPGEDLDLKSVYLEGKYQMTDQKDGWWLSSGLLGEYVFNADDGPEKVEAKLLFQRDEELFRHRGNIILEREVGGGDSDEIEIGSRWFSRWNLDEHFKPAIEWHAEWGTTSDIKSFDEQKHWVGPGIYGDLIKFSDGSKIEYETAYNFGITSPAEDGVFRLKLEYKKQF